MEGQQERQESLALPRAFEDAYSGDDMSIYVKRGGWSTLWVWNILLAIAVGFMIFGMSGCCDGVQTEERYSANPVKDIQYQITSITRANHNGSSLGTIYTFEHDGHLFICQYPNFIMHHPDCPCQAKQVEIEASE